LSEAGNGQIGLICRSLFEDLAQFFGDGFFPSESDNTAGSLIEPMNGKNISFKVLTE